MGNIREFKLEGNQKYFDELLAELTETSVLQYKSTCDRFLEQVNKPLLKIDIEDVETFITNNGKSIAQVRNMTAHIRKLYYVAIGMSKQEELKEDALLVVRMLLYFGRMK